jgi:hypothetical protein
MEETQLKQLIHQIKYLGDYNSPNISDPVTLRSSIMPRLTWDAAWLEEILNIQVPPDLRILWDETSGLALFADIVAGQSGLVIWSPEQTSIRHQYYVSIRQSKIALPTRKPLLFAGGDLCIGEFLGDDELLVIRCDPTSSDFGSILIALSLDPRDEWYNPASSLGEFLQSFVEAHGEKFWEVH